MMKKVSKLVFTGLLLGGFILPSAGCVKPSDPFVPPESSDKVIINDAYDWNEDETGSNRPDLDGGYVPVPPAKEAVVTIAEGSKIKLKDNATSVTLAVGEMLNASHFDEATLDGHTLGGVAVVDDEGNVTEVSSLKQFLPTKSVTVIPYYSLEKGDDLIFGSDKIGDWILNGEFEDISKEITIASGIQVKDGWLDKKIDVTGTLAKDSSFRALTSMTVNEGYTYNYNYKFTNYGDKEISFTAYQMISGYRWDNAENGVAIKKITLAAGATSEIVSAKLENNKPNTNVITVIKAEEEVENLSLGVAMTVEDKTVKTPVEVTLRLPQGVTVDGYKTDMQTFDKLVIPTKEQVTDKSGLGEIYGWYDVETKKPVNGRTTLFGPMTIAPYWRNIDGYNYIDIGSGKNEGYNNDALPGDIGKHISDKTGSVSYQGSRAGSTNNGVVLERKDGHSLLGAILSDTMPVQAGSAIRFDSSRSTGDGIYEINTTIVNYGTSNLHLSVYHINASSDYKSTGGWYRYENERHRVDIQLKPGESTSKIGQYDLPKNGNWMTYIVFEQDVDSFSFGISEGYRQVDAIDTTKYPGGNLLDKKANISYNKDENGGIVVKDEYLTQRVGRFLVAPAANQIEVPETVTLTGWKLVIGGKEYDLNDKRVNYKDLQLPSSGATLKAVYLEISTTSVDVTLQAPNGVNIDGAKTTYKTGEKLELPAISQTTTDGRKHTGWYNVATGEIVTADTVVENAITLAPYFVPANTALTPASGVQGDDKALDSFTNLTRDNFEKIVGVSGDEAGIIFNYNGTIAEGDAFRFKTFYYEGGSKNAAAGTYKFHFAFTNYGTEEIKFNVYQVNGGTNKIEDGKANKEVTVAVGETVSVTLEIAITSNKNALTYFEMLCNINGMQLGVSMSIEGLAA